MYGTLTATISWGFRSYNAKAVLKLIVVFSIHEILILRIPYHFPHWPVGRKVLTDLHTHVLKVPEHK